MPQILMSILLFTCAFAESRPPCTPELTPTIDVARLSARVAEPELRARGFGRRAGAYAVLIGAMVASAAATTYLTSHLPTDLHFLSQLIGQVSTLGVYVFGAPIWEPLSSAFRKLAFEVEGAGVASVDPRHEAQWYRTQNTYSLNEQMGRNIAVAFLSSNHQSFYEARRAMQTSDVTYAADQVAAAAVRLRLHFADLPADESTIAMAVRTSFTSHVAVDGQFRAEVARRIQALDPAAGAPEPKRHYAAVLDAWLSPPPR